MQRVNTTQNSRCFVAQTAKRAERSFVIFQGVLKRSRAFLGFWATIGLPNSKLLSHLSYPSTSYKNAATVFSCRARLFVCRGYFFFARGRGGVFFRSNSRPSSNASWIRVEISLLTCSAPI